MSKHLSTSQLRAIDKLGDCMLPGAGILPRFSEIGCVSQVDRVLDYMPAQDLNDLKGLLTVIAWMPTFVVALLLQFLEVAPLAVLRFARLGIRGLVMTLYYSDPEVHRAIGYDVRVYLGDH